MNKTLLPFQKVGAEFLASHPHALLADQPGLGKTIQAIAAVEMVDAQGVLVVCPASVRSNWYSELRECLGRNDPNWMVISYNEAVNFSKDQRFRNYNTIIIDEAHFCKTPDSQRTLAIFGKDGLARRARYKWCLTGTPVLNRPRELYPILKTLAPAFADYSYAKYTQRYCGAYFDGRGINTKGATNLDELSNLLDSFMLRRTKKDAFPGRSEPLIHLLPLDISSMDLREVYAEEELIGAREAKLSSTAEEYSQLGDTSRLLRLTGLAKVEAVSGFVTDLLETVEKVVVFAHHREVISQLFENFSRKGFGPVVYHGGMSDGQKTNAVSLFQEPQSCVFIGQRQAAGVGINGLQNVCSTAVIAEPSWVPGETEQMIDRLDRMGSCGELVTAYILYAPGTLDEAVVRVHSGKKKVINRIMNDNDPFRSRI